MSIDDHKRKIRSLLALAAPKSGATDAERATARKFAEKLMQAHGLTEQDIPERQVARPQPAPPPPPVNAPPQVVIRIYVGGFNSFNNTTGTTNSGYTWGLF